MDIVWRIDGDEARGGLGFRLGQGFRLGLGLGFRLGLGLGLRLGLGLGFRLGLGLGQTERQTFLPLNALHGARSFSPQIINYTVPSA